MRVKVLREFRDGSDFSKLYKAGDEVDISDKARIERLLALKLVESKTEAVKNGNPKAKSRVSTKVAERESADELQPNTEE